MIPSLLAREVRASILDYLRTTFAFSDEAFEAALFQFLEGPSGMFKGPYVDIRLPFRKAAEGEAIPLELKPAFRPYAHQLAAFHRLHTTEGHQPQHTLITTGTGSGKTECFLYPILDHCLRHHGEPGIKAIILYPMNALASDQARRLAAELQRDVLKDKVRAGLYVGGHGTHGVSGPDHLVDKREMLRQDPPDILLTNYKMLDFLLLRPEDRGLWEKNRPETLRYLVLDELHTYDGAQGSDVACLIRRLRARLEAPKWGFGCVGTSATIGGKERAASATSLREFAETVFGVSFDPHSVIGEERETANEALGPDPDLHQMPDPGAGEALVPAAFEAPESYLERQALLWFGKKPESRGELAERLSQHSFLRTVLLALDGEPRDYEHLSRVLSRLEPGFAALSEVGRTRALDSFFSLVAQARRAVAMPGGGTRLEPFLTCQAQLWVRELRRLVQKVPHAAEEPPLFGFFDDLDRSDPKRRFLLLAHCAECGGHGLAAIQREADPKLIEDPAQVGQRWINDSRECRYVVPNPPAGSAPDQLIPLRLNPSTLEVSSQTAQSGLIPILFSPEEVAKQYNKRCPECGTDGALGILGARAASLLSVGITQLFQSEFNEDRKLLAFVDSVQDASHRAAFFGARTYRFNIRTAIQGALERAKGTVPLTEVADQVTEFAALSLKNADSIAVLTPPDLRNLPEYERFHEERGTGDNRALFDGLKLRLSWETIAEYGFDAMRGRTLERTGCSVAFPDQGRLDRAAERLALDLQEQNLLTPKVDREQALTAGRVRHVLAGLIHRLRVRGGVFHPFLEDYVRQDGKFFLLTKPRNSLMSTNVAVARRPRFLHSLEKHKDFDSYVSAPGGDAWHRDFAARALSLDRRDEHINELYRLGLRRLAVEGLIREVATSKGSAFGLEPGALLVHLAPTRVRCGACARVTTVPQDELAHWSGQACLRHRCTGHLAPEGRVFASYYQQIYRSGALRRIFSAEHTGLLEREDRESLEARFKATEAREPDAPNLLVATPTLEMGIDIGDLSAVTLCAVPPATANYLQRVGRAGRKTGNAFTFTLATAQPKDLYFFAAPREMLAGEVLPPGAFLDAPYMLYRQLVAFAMDRWAHDETEVHNIPPEVRFVLGESGKRFPGRFLEHYRANHAQIVPEFLRLFGDLLSKETQQKVRDFGSPEVLPLQVSEAFERVRTEREELRALKGRLEKRRQELEADPGLSGMPEVELEDVAVNIKVVTRLIDELGKKYPLNTLTDEGVLPNYSFPEPGVTLKSVVRRRKPERRRGEGGEEAKAVAYDAMEYQRPASSAIRELAPFNSFYADGRRLEINEIDIGNKARPLLETWRFCSRCSHTERVHDPVTEPSAECPRCRATKWSDQGQVRTMVHFRRARSLSDNLADASDDSKDERTQQSYEVKDLIDVGASNFVEAQVIESLPFGVEFLRDVTLREVNFGFAESSGSKLEVDGVKVQEQGFVVCAECGRVKKPGFGGTVDHAAFCKHKKTQALTENLHELYLYRQIESEAIRVLLPVSTIEVDRARASFKAAIDLGFRRRFRGNPQHLLIRYVSEPIGPEGPDRRHFLVIYDGVPGGTGYLPGLWKQEATTGSSGLLGVLQLAYDAMRACECRQQPERDGCYRCVLAYQSQRDLPFVSRRKALELLQPVLERRAEMKNVATLSEVSLDDRLESELEVRFRDALKEHAQKTPGMAWEETIHGGKLLWKIRFADGPTWQLEPQVDLGYAHGITKPSRPDFVLRAIAGAPEAKPVAVFCDGLAFHACPSQAQGRIHDDVEKRQAIIDSESHRVWSVTWKDIEAFQEGRGPRKDDPELFGLLDLARVKQAFQAAKVEMPPEMPRMNTLALLLHYLAHPEAERWRRAAEVLLAAAVLVSSSKLRLSTETLNRLENRIQTRPEHFPIQPMGLFDGQGVPHVMGYVHGLPWVVLMARAQTQQLQQQGYGDTRAYLRLFDEHVGREDSGFEPSWRQFLAAWNWMQFHAETKVYTSEGLQRDGVQAVDTADLAAEGGGSKPYRPAADGGQPKLVELLGFIADETCRELVRAIATQGVELPEAGYEVEVGGRVLGDVELAWPGKKVAVTVAGQEDAGRSLQAQGWVIFASDVQPTELKQALKPQGAKQ